MTSSPTRVAYLLGAGATHACAQAVNSSYGLLMRDLSDSLIHEARNVMSDVPYTVPRDLVNAIVTTDSDFEHIITFLDNSVSATHRQLANELRRVFERVLRGRLAQVKAELSKGTLYDVLLDTHELYAATEHLVGVLSLNYDSLVEEAVERSRWRTVDYGVAVDGYSPDAEALPLLKLHGSFSWDTTWPVRLGESNDPQWIPPGIDKAKNRYPFTLLWARARELLNCDVLRVIGCRLSPNDWDLVSLLFSAQHDGRRRAPYTIEIIDSPVHGSQLAEQYPYLLIQSLLDIPNIGDELVSELLNRSPTAFRDLDSITQKEVHDYLRASPRNWFRQWLILRLEAHFQEFGTVDTRGGAASRLMEERG